MFLWCVSCLTNKILQVYIQSELHMEFGICFHSGHRLSEIRRCSFGTCRSNSITFPYWAIRMSLQQMHYLLLLEFLPISRSNRNHNVWWRLLQASAIIEDQVYLYFLCWMKIYYPTIRYAFWIHCVLSHNPGVCLNSYPIAFENPPAH